MKAHSILSLLICGLILIFQPALAEKIIRIGVIEDFKTLNPLMSQLPGAASYYPFIFDNLLRLDNITGQATMVLAEEFKWIDPKTLFVKIKNPIPTHNGNLLGPNDIITSIERYKELKHDSSLMKYYKNINNVDYDGQGGFIFHWNEVDSSNINLLNFLFMLPPESFGNNFEEIGTGPYRLASRLSNTIILKKFDQYHGKKPLIDEIHIVRYDNFSQLWAAMYKNEIDLTLILLPQDHEFIIDDKRFQSHPFLGAMYYALTFNLEHDMFKEQSTRIALNLAINKEVILNEVLHGRGNISVSTIHPDHWLYDSSLTPYPYDPQKALTMLMATGWGDANIDGILDKNGKDFAFKVLLDKGDELKKETARLIGLQLFEVGIKMDVDYIERGEMIEKYLLPRKFDSAMIQFRSVDPAYSYGFWHSSQIAGGMNCFGYRNLQVDEALDRGRMEPEIELQKKYYLQYQKSFIENPPGVLLFYHQASVVARSNIKGLNPNIIFLWNNFLNWDIN